MLSNFTTVFTLESYMASLTLILNHPGYSFRMGTSLHLTHICNAFLVFSGKTQDAFQHRPLFSILSIILTVLSTTSCVDSVIFKCRLPEKYQPSEFPNPLHAKACFLTLLLQSIYSSQIEIVKTGWEKFPSVQLFSSTL